MSGPRQDVRGARGAHATLADQHDDVVARQRLLREAAIDGGDEIRIALELVSALRGVPLRVQWIEQDGHVRVDGSSPFH